MRLYLLKHKGYKTSWSSLVDVITHKATENVGVVDGVIAFITLKAAKKQKEAYKRKYGVDYEIVKFESKQ